MRAGRPAPFVGRDDELAWLAACVDAADPPVVVVRGVAGVGKTRLVREALDRAAAPTVFVRCWDDSAPMWCWSEAVERLGLDSSWRSVDDRLERFTALRTTLLAHAPLVIGLDDVHLADAASLLFAKFLARTAAGRGLVVVATARPDVELGDLIADARELVLHPLAPEHARAMLRGPLGVPGTTATTEHDDEAAWADAVLAMSSGLPLTLERAASEVRDGGAVDLTASVGRAVASLGTAGGRVVRAAALRTTPCSAAELAVVAGVSAEEVVSAIASATAAGLLDATTGEMVGFVHDLVRQAVAASAPPHERLELHRAWWRATAGGDPTLLPLAAAHASAVAAADPSVTSEVVDLWFDLAEEHGRRGALETALEAADAAAALADRAAIALPVHRRVAHADVALQAGRLARARELYRRAAEVAERDGDPLALADAAAGLGGIWLQEHRDAHVAASVEALQRRALAAVAHVDPVRALRLRTRLAGEAAYGSRDVDQLIGLLDETRRSAPPRQLAEALSIAIHAALAPEHTEQRLTWAREMTQAAAAAGDAMALLLAQCWTTTALILAGDPTAARERRTFELRCTTLRCASLEFIVEAMAVGELVTAGRFEAAEHAATACFETGQAVGDADAWNYYAAHLALIRWFQGRHGELVSFARDAALAPTLLPGERALAATAALFALDDGDRVPAERVVALHRDAPSPRHYQPSTWTVAMYSTARLAWMLHDADLGADVASQIEPYLGLPTILSLGVADLGPVDWTHGLALAASGRLDEAAERLVEAESLARRRGHRPAAAMIAADLAEVLRQAGWHEEATTRLRGAASAAGDLGMTGWAERWVTRLDEWSLPEPSGGTVAVERVIFERLGRSQWRCSLRRGASSIASVVVDDSVGVRHLAVLCSAAGTDVPASRLAYLSQPVEAGQEVLDDHAVDALRDRADHLRRRLDLCEGDRATIEDELDAVTDQLLHAVGLGRRRTFADAGERARTAVRKAITRAIGRLADLEPAIGDHLREHVHTGHVCRYAVDPDV